MVDLSEENEMRGYDVEEVMFERTYSGTFAELTTMTTMPCARYAA